VAVAERECGRDRLRVVDSHRSEADGRKVHAGLSDRPTQKTIGSTIERLCPVQIFSSVSTGVRPQMLTRSWRSSIHIGGLTGELGRASVRTPDERGVDPGVVGGEHVRLVVADENRGLGAEVFEGALDVVRRRLLPREAGDGGLTAVCDLEPPGEPEVVEDRVDGCLLVRGDDPERGVEMAERVDIVVGVLPPLPSRVDLRAPRRSRREPARTRPGRARSARRYPSE